MQRAAFRKQTQDDFRLRVRRVDPGYNRHGEAAVQRNVPRRPFGSLIAGFAWAYLVVSVATNRETISASLQQGSLPEAWHGHVMMTLAALIAVSLVGLALQVIRFFFQDRRRRGNSGSLLAGALGALALVYMPADVWHLGYGLLDDNSRALLLGARDSVSEALPGVEFGAVSFVSSLGLE